jgi:hypothetical protein
MKNDTEQRYTLREAQLELARLECDRDGHAWDVGETLAGPVRIVCRRCGWVGNVTMTPRT